MRKLIISIIIVGLLLVGFGCATINESEWAQHSSQYKNWDHMKFSCWGYKNPTDETLEKSESQGWWGVPVE